MLTPSEHAGLLTDHVFQEEIEVSIRRLRVLRAARRAGQRVQSANGPLVVNQTGPVEMALPVVSEVAVKKLERAGVLPINLGRRFGWGVRFRIQRQAEDRRLPFPIAVCSLFNDGVQKNLGGRKIRLISRRQ